MWYQNGRGTGRDRFPKTIVSTGWLFLGALVSTRARFRFANR
jgi:hypothetical protein